MAKDVAVPHPHLQRLPKRGKKLRLGEVLLRSGAITAEQLTQALEQQREIREFFPRRTDGLLFRKGTGCRDCHYSGYRGRTTIVELWVPDDEDIRLITKNASSEQVRLSARRTTLPMCDSMLGVLEQGRTNLEELIRVVPQTTLADFRQRQLLSRAAVSA